MPSTLTHYFFNNDLLKETKHKDIFILGGQGADPLFFYGYSLSRRKNRKDIRKLGNTLHGINPDKLYFEMLKYSFDKKGEEKEILLSFTKGFMYHYALDRTIHPYVFYKGGFPYTNPRYNRNHGNIESIIDTLLADKYKFKYTTRKTLKCSKEKVKICSLMLYEIINKLLNIEYIDEKFYYNAYKDFKFVRFIVDSKYGIKKALFNKLMKNSNINIISQPRKVKDDENHDYLNFKKEIWIHPVSGETKRDSIDDLFIKAKEECRIIDNIIYNFKDNIVTQRKITTFTNNINHDGKDLDKYMTYFKVIWRQE